MAEEKPGIFSWKGITRFVHRAVAAVKDIFRHGEKKKKKSDELNGFDLTLPKELSPEILKKLEEPPQLTVPDSELPELRNKPEFQAPPQKPYYGASMLLSQLDEKRSTPASITREGSIEQDKPAAGASKAPSLSATV